MVSDQLSSDLASLKIDRQAAPSGGTGRRFLIWIVVLAVLGYAVYSFALPAAKSHIFVPEVEITEISLYSAAQAAVELTSTGYVEPQLVSKVSPKIPGRVARVHVDEGQAVEKGALLLELDRADREAAIQAARTRVAAARARVLTARANLAETTQQASRERGLAQRGVSPQARADDLEARATALAEQVKAAEAEVKAAAAEVKALEVDLGYTRVEAPISGTVLNKPPEVGELVGVDFGGDKTIELADFSTLLVETDIPEGRLHMVALGAPAEIVLDAFPKKRFRGEAVEISPRVNRAKATVGVKVKFVDPAEGVLPDMSARVSFLSEALDAQAIGAEPKRVVPAAALAERAGEKVVFVIEEDKVRMQIVDVGEALGAGFELRDGPPSGTRVVRNPNAELADGQKIKEKS